jgi:hypothetical protein
MRQPDSRPGPDHPGASHPDGGSPPVTAAAIGRLAALGGLGFLVTSLASDLVVGPFPGPYAPPAQLASFYAAHHAQVGTGGLLLALSGVFFVLFGLAIWARIQQAPASPLLAGLTMIATTLAALTTLASAGTYGVLGDIGGQLGVAPAALQAWHIMGSDGSLADSASTFLFLLAMAGAGILARVLPRWLAWTALLLAVLQLVPNQIGFLASLVFLVWTAAAGISLLFARGGRQARQGREDRKARQDQTGYAVQEEVRHA